MPYVVTQSCCNDASCVYACPVNCIHPTPDEPEFARAEMLYVDPAACMDCGACATACPTEAIVPHTKLTADQQIFLELNADFYREPAARARPLMAPVPPKPVLRKGLAPLRIAIVGSGPAAMYAADELLAQPGAVVNVFERLEQPYGLAEFGVAPDHRKTRQVTGLFDAIAKQDGFRFFGGVEVGRDITHAELLRYHHAVIYAVGASADRRLGIPGEELPGSAAATDFVAWYNGHPDQRDSDFALDHERAVVIGNGNVALDVARILTTDPDELERTGIAPHAVMALRESRIREVLVLGRRGVAQAAFTVPELIGLRAHRGADLTVVPGEIAEGPADPAELDPVVRATRRRKLEIVRALPPVRSGGARQITLRFGVSPAEILGTERVSGIRLERNELTVDGDTVRAMPTGEFETIDAGSVFRAVGYHGRPVADLPFHPGHGGIVPNIRGRVLNPSTEQPMPRTYVAGWIKRGPTGFLGTNKSCSQETVASLLADLSERMELVNERLPLPLARR
ncbi:FAD-dependent oxidoreductase [Nocardia sp. NPDC020380]|uniref:FAD-dependent oxidoreductase n=1 Tax=Nocardia sp. NPDC020380 TaxID=3364309 RepID=UPI00378A47A8